MAGEQESDEVQRWTAKRRAALVMSMIKGETTAAEAAPPAPKRRARLRVANNRIDFEHLAGELRGLKSSVLVGFEATGNYNRPLAYFLHRQGFELRIIPTSGAL